MQTEINPGRDYPGTSVCRFHMCGDRVLMQDLEVKQHTGSIILPQGVRIMDLVKARVVAVGPDVNTVQCGDIVIHVPELGTRIQDPLTKVEYLQLPENAMIAIDTEFSEDEISTDKK